MNPRPLTQYRFGILGAGTTGLSLAQALIKRGFKNVKVFDKAASLYADGRLNGALLFSGNGVRVLDAHNARKDMFDHQPLIHTGYQTPNGRASSTHNHLEIGRRSIGDVQNGVQPDSPAIALARSAFIPSLESQLPQGTVVYQHALKRVEFDPEENYEVSLEFASGETATVDVLLAADGRESIVRGNFFESAPRRVDLSQWWVSGVAPGVTDWPYPNVCHEVVGTGYRVWAASMGPGRGVGWKGVVFNELHEMPSVNDMDPVTLGEKVFAPAPREVTYAITQTKASDLMYGEVFHWPALTGWSMYGGHLVLVGSAAHPICDALNQHHAMSFESAEILSLCLAEAAANSGQDDAEKALAGAVARYESLRRARVHNVTGESYGSQQLLNSQSSLMTGLRSVADWMNRPAGDISAEKLVGFNLWSDFGGNPNIL